MPAVAGFAPALSRSPSPRLGLPRILPFARSLQARLGESLALPRGLPTISDISISFPPWMIAWFLLGEATPFITLVLISSVAAFFFSRGTGRTRRARWLKWTLAIVGGVWLGGISFWAAGLVDQVKTDIYQAQHHYRLDKATVLAGTRYRGRAGSRLMRKGCSTGSRLPRTRQCRSTARRGGATFGLSPCATIRPRIAG